LALIGLTLAFLFIANTVSAWGRRDAGDIEDIKSHAEHFVGRALDRLDATDEQSAAIQTIVAATINDLYDARGDRAVDRQDLRDLVLAEAINRDAIEQFRQSHMARAEEMSQIVAAGLADIMDVLTPEQRRELEAHFDQHHGRHRGWGWH
jgi:Spy/CpxP family protein refolding chaperone